MTTAKSLISALEQCSKTVCNKVTESLDSDEHGSLLNSLKARIAELEAAAGPNGESLATSKSGEVQAALIIARGWQVKLLERINSIISAKQVTPVVKKRSVKLPDIKLITFKGEFDEWNTFWSSFRNNVDYRDDLEPSAKLSYMLQSVGGTPKKMIKGLPNTDQNYTIAIRLLTDRYGDEIKQSHVLFQKFHNLPSPKHNARDLRSFLTEYRKVREQMRSVTNIEESKLVVRSILIRKLSMPTYEVICDYNRSYDFSLKQMGVALQYIVDKFEHASLAMGEKTNVKSVEAKSSQQKHRSG